MNKKIVILLPAAVVVILFVFFFIPNSRNGESEETMPIPSAVVESSDEQTIKSLLDTKYNLDPSDTKLTLVENRGDYAVGGFNEIASPAGGGQWFAAKVDGNWQIVYDGNGVITCDYLDNYPDYPVDLIPSCWDKQTNEMVER